MMAAGKLSSSPRVLDEIVITLPVPLAAHSKATNPTMAYLLLRILLNQIN
jgi:hypothetical protein